MSDDLIDDSTEDRNEGKSLAELRQILQALDEQERGIIYHIRVLKFKVWALRAERKECRRRRHNTVTDYKLALSDHCYKAKWPEELAP